MWTKVCALVYNKCLFGIWHPAFENVAEQPSSGRVCVRADCDWLWKYVHHLRESIATASKMPYSPIQRPVSDCGNDECIRVKTKLKCMCVICWCIVCAQHNVNSGNCFICFVWFVHPLVQMAFGCIYTLMRVYRLLYHFNDFATHICCTNTAWIYSRQWTAKLNAIHEVLQWDSLSIYKVSMLIWYWYHSFYHVGQKQWRIVYDFRTDGWSYVER